MKIKSKPAIFIYIFLRQFEPFGIEAVAFWESGFKNKYSKETTLNGEAAHIIYLYPKNPSSVEYHTIILYISKDKNELKKVIMKTKDGTTMTYSLTKFTTDATIADSKFVFDSKKYPGYNVIRD